MLENEINILKDNYDKVDERYFKDVESKDFEFWSDLYYDVDVVASDAIELIESLQAEIKERGTVIEVLRNGIIKSEEEVERLEKEIEEAADAYDRLYDYVEELEEDLEETQNEIEAANEEINELLR